MSCISCKRNIDSYYKVLCIVCWAEIKFIFQKDSNDHYAVVEYNHIIKKLIHTFKYQSPWMLCDLFVNWISLIHNKLIYGIDIVIPVPIHKHKVMKRGYNQSAVLSRKLAEKYGKKCFVGVLLKTHQTKSQSSLNSYERRTNVVGSFATNKRLIHSLRGKSILLVDDVITTGSTLLECKRSLNESGVLKVQTLCIAITQYDSSMDS
jgi:ComF family protein